MNNKKNISSVIALIVIGILTIVFFCIRYYGPQAVEDLYAKGNFSVLNAWAHASGNQPLGFYLGSLEDQIFGPLSVLVSMIALLICSLYFLQEVDKKTFALALFIYFLIFKWEILFFPPYGDSTIGPFVEAIWLLRNSFDFHGLSQQLYFMYGGPKVYLLTFYPTFLAILMKVIPSVKIFLLVNHLTVFLIASIVLTFFRETLLKIFSPLQALLGTILLLSLPLFQSQSEAINMEMPTLLFGMLSMYFLFNQKLSAASIFAILAAWVKPTAVFYSGTVFVAGIFLFFTAEQYKFKIKTLIFAFVPLVLALAQAYGEIAFVKVNMIGSFQGLNQVISFQETYLYLVSFLFLLAALIKEKISQTKEKLISILKKHYMGLVAFVCASGWFVVFINSTAGFPRYRLVLLPFGLFFALYVVNLYIKSKQLLNAVLIIFIMFYSVCSYGLFSKPIVSTDQMNDHVHLERSLEYRKDEIFRMKVAKEIEDKYSDYKIGAPFVVAQNLALPELGYVHKKLNVMIYGFPCTYGGIEVFKGVKKIEDVQHIIWFGHKSTINQIGNFSISYPVGPRDLVLEKIAFGDREGTLFQGGESIEKMRLISKAFLVYLAKRGKLKDSYELNFGLDQ